MMVEQLDAKSRKARKEHQCNWCLGIIKKGEIYDWSKNVYEGNLYEWKNHKHCMEIAHHFNMFDYDDDGLCEDSFHEAVREEYFILFGDYPDDDKSTHDTTLELYESIKEKDKC